MLPNMYKNPKSGSTRTIMMKATGSNSSGCQRGALLTGEADERLGPTEDVEPVEEVLDEVLPLGGHWRRRKLVESVVL